MDLKRPRTGSDDVLRASRSSSSHAPSSLSLPQDPALEAELYRCLLDPGDLDHICGRAFGLLSRRLAFDWVGLIQDERASGASLLTAAWRPERAGEPLALDTAASTHGWRASDLPSLAVEDELPAAWGRPLTDGLRDDGLGRVLFVPFDGASAGAGVVFGARSREPFDAAGRALMERIAGPLGRTASSLGRERELEGRVEERTRELAVLYGVSRTLGTTLGLEDMAALVMGSLHELLDYEIAAMLLDLPGTSLVSLHLPRPAAAEVRFEAASLARDAFRELAGRVAEDTPPVVRKLEDYDPEAPPVAGRLVSSHAAPLVRRGAIVGTLVVASTRRPAFADGRLRLLQTLASQASLTLDRLRTHQEAEQGRVQSIIDSMPLGVLMTDLELRVAFANPAARRTLEALTGEASPAALTHLGGVSVRDIARPVLSEDLDTTTTEIRIEDPRRIFSVSVSPVWGSVGAPRTGIVVTIADVTEARMMQEQLQQSEKLSALGEMISGVAHELNNPLASVMGFAQLLQSARVREDVRRKLQIVYSEAQRCQRVVQNLLSFARKHQPEQRLVDLNGALGSVLSLLSYQLRVDAIEVRTELDPQLPGVFGDFHLLQQVFLNIINNAHQAMKEAGAGGRLDVATRSVDAAGADGVADRSSGAGPGMARIEIRDTGPGISPENLKKIFDPFFTTKKPGLGTGLGLSLAYGAVREHRGRIYARSTVGKGTTFVIEIPQGSVDGRAAAEAPAREPEAPRRAGAILVVDDEPIVARLLVEALSSKGHRVDAVVAGSDALDRIRRRRYDVVISDLKMPGMDGRALFEAIQAADPALARRMILSTGDVATAQTRAFVESSGVRVIAKPFDLRDVHRLVGEILTLAPRAS